MIVTRDTSNAHSQFSLGLLGRYFKLKLVIVSMFTLFGWARDAASATLPPWLVKTLERLSAEANFRTTGHSENVASPRRVCNKLCSSLGHKFPNAPLMVVISPLNWLIKDQITSCERIGIKACKVEVENSTSLLEVRDYDILFASPEVFENPLVAKRLTRYCDRIIGIVIDESSKGGTPWARPIRKPDWGHVVQMDQSACSRRSCDLSIIISDLMVNFMTLMSCQSLISASMTS